MLITDRNASSHSVEDVAEEALRAGFTAVQLRERDLPAKELYKMAVSLREITRRHDALLIVNDRIDVALAAEADAAQLSYVSLDVPAARKAADGRLAIGVSAHNVVEMRLALRNRVDCVIFGPVFSTPSKADFVEPVGVEKMHAMAVPAPMPVVAVGGIDKSNVGRIAGTRAAGVAVIRAVMAASNPFQAATEFIEAAQGVAPPPGQ
jgi:thiamine-phosphate pyrophosphorylase